MFFINGLRSLLFNVAFYGFNIVYLIIFMLPFVVLGNEPALRKGIYIYCKVNMFLARWIMGVRCEWRGAKKLPTEGAIILAASHQSYLDPMMAYMLRQDVSALAKVELSRVPVIGGILKVIGILFVERGKGTAHKQMQALTQRILDKGICLIVYPQATRVKPGTRKPLKSGAYHLHQDTGLPVYTVATNTGLFWTRGFFHRPGKAVFEVVRKLPDNLNREDFMNAIKEDVVYRSDDLYAEAGFENLIPADDKRPASPAEVQV